LTVLVMGFDAGGTHVTAFLADVHRRVLGQGRGGPANPRAVPWPAVETALRDAAQAAFANAGLTWEAPDAAVIGMAGATTPDLQADYAARLQAAGIAHRVWVVEDARIAVAGATESGEGIILISGTGVNAFGVVGGRTAKASGWGYLVGDEGSGFDIGRRAIQAVLWAYDGRGPATALTEAVLSQWQTSTPEKLLDTVYVTPLPRDKIAALAPVVAAVAWAGDDVAQAIYAEAGRQLALAAAAVVRRLGVDPAQTTIALVGGVFQAEALVTAPLRATLATELGATPTLVTPLHPPAYGAVRLALGLIGSTKDTKIHEVRRKGTQG
jgi:N-acetylglucosamine kinase-like BadF-type ATPase